jgi:hypothetical protein
MAPRKEPEAPSGWVIDGKDKKNGKTMMRCTSLRQGVQCGKRIRVTNDPPHHRCFFPPGPGESQSTLQTLFCWTDQSYAEKTQLCIATLAAAADAPLRFVEEPAVHSAINELLKLARQHPDLKVGPGGVALSEYRTRNTLTTAARRIQTDAVRRFSYLPAVSMTIDAGTIERRHFLDIMLLAPYTESGAPFLYDTVEVESLTSEDYGNIVAGVIQTLKDEHQIEVKSIVGDNLPAQVSALAHWSHKSRLRGTNPLLNRVKFSPCLCHTIQLIVGDLISPANSYEPGLVQGWDRLLHHMIETANAADVHRVLKHRCPQTVGTRWLSRLESLQWLLYREWSLRQAFQPVDASSCRNRAERTAATRTNELADVFSEENFDALEKFHQLLFPLTTAVKYFERNQTTLAYVYPALKNLKEYARQQRDDPIIAPDLAGQFRALLASLSFRRRRHLDWDMIKAAFYLTSFGCHFFNGGGLRFEAELLFQYHSPRQRERPAFPSYTFGTKDGDEEAPNLAALQEECLWECDTVVVEEDPVRIRAELGLGKRDILAFLTKYLTRLMEEDGDLASLPPDDASWADLDTRVEAVVSQFLCNQNWIRRCSRIIASMGRQVELWNFFAGTQPDHAFDDIAKKVISIITIPASEASCERSFSRQKRLSTHRARANPDLLLARIRFQDFNAVTAPVAPDPLIDPPR